MNPNIELPKDIHLKHLDLFSGGGLFGLAARWSGLETVAFSKIENYANQVLHKQFPSTRNLGDIRKLCRRIGDCEWLDEETAWCHRCDEEFSECACVGTDQFADDFGYPHVISAGFPCQDVSWNSHTGTGTDGERSGLAFEALRVVTELRPAFLLLENVPALKSRGYDSLHEKLAQIDYTCEPFVVGANALGASQRRKRVWIVAHDTLQRIQGLRSERLQVAHTLAPAFLPLRRGDGQWEIEPDLRRTVDGNARWMDRLKVIGNAVVPQIPVMFFDFMWEVLQAQHYQARLRQSVIQYKAGCFSVSGSSHLERNNMKTLTQSPSKISSKAWTSVRQEMPDDETSVLACQAGTDDYAVAYHTGEPFDAWRYADNGLLVPWPVTHWTELLPTPAS